MKLTTGLGIVLARIGRRRMLIGLLVLGVAASGLYLASLSQANTFFVDRKIERVSISGNASFEKVAGSASSQVVRFGTNPTPAPNPNPPTPPPGPNPTPTPLPLPTQLRAHTGGDSIGLTWLPVIAGDYVKTYDVYRDGTKIATTQPDTNERAREIGTQYVDRNVVRGQRYSYQVRAVQGDRTSPLTAAVAATHPTSGVGVPNVVLDSTISQHLGDRVAWFNSHVIPAIKTWYPKIANVIAYPDYTPPSTITIKSVSQADYDRLYPPSAAVAVGTTFIMNPRLTREQPSYAVYAAIHEAGHVIQQHAGGKFDGTIPRWIVEGTADYGSLSIYNGYPWSDLAGEKINTNNHYVDGYHTATQFLRRLEERYSIPYIRQSNVAGFRNTFGPEHTVFSDGRNFDQAWGVITGTPSKTGEFRHAASNKCLDDSGARLDRGNRMILWPCNNNLAQRITFYQVPQANNLMLVFGHCIEVANGATENNWVVWINYCSRNDPAQHWVKRSDGSIFNPNSGRCLAPFNGSNADAAQIVITTCNGSTHQRWNTP